jgi:uncharacterized protein (UPF0264 family)
VPRIDLRKANDRPRLLVSVRSAVEANAAIAGGADILDVKDPAQGSLGRPDLQLLQAVSQCASACGLPVTTALGEVVEWADERPFVIPADVTFAKLGLAGLRRRQDWVDRWLAVREIVQRDRPQIGWVAVAYVDEAAAASPPLEEVVSAAIATGCAGLLLDTCDKSAGRLHDSVSEQQLEVLAERIHSAEMFIAAAGRLSLRDVARLGATSVDVIAVRSAACEKHDRRGTVTTEAVADCKSAIAACGQRPGGSSQVVGESGGTIPREKVPLTPALSPAGKLMTW